MYRDLDAAGLPEREGEPRVGPEADLPDLPRVGGTPDPGLIGWIAARRRAVAIPPEPQEARYLRGADVTLAPRKRVRS